jgi:hypothetical protein
MTMPDPRVEDLLSLDRDVACGWSAIERWRAALVQDPDEHADDRPLESVRHVAGKSTWEALGEASLLGDASLREALRRWVYALIQARINGSDEVAWARAASEARAVFAGEARRRVSWRDAWRGVVAAKTMAEAGLWLEAAADLAPALAAVARVRAARRVEVAHRLGFDHPWAPLSPISPAQLRAAAARLLDATEDLSRAVWKDAMRGAADKTGAAAAMHLAAGREAGEGWPAHLTTRWLEGVFGVGLRGLSIEPMPLPATLGAASFARALSAFGFAVRVAVAASSMPFALAREPSFVGAHRFGFVFGALAADAGWQERTLGVGRRAALAQSRVLARSALLEARLHAARLLLGDDAAPAPQEQFEDIGVRLFERELDPRLRGAWPAAREDEPARFLGLIESVSLARSLRDQFDSDWFRNPRAWGHLRALGGSPAHEPVDASALAVQVDSVARTLEVALG